MIHSIPVNQLNEKGGNKIKKHQLSINPVKKLALIDIIIDQIGCAIAKGNLKAGDTLPSERELSEMLNVSRTSIRQALKALDVLGVVRIVHGANTHLRKSIGELLINPIKFMVLLHDIDEVQVIKERKLIEVELIRIAVDRITDNDIKELELNIEKLKKCREDRDKFINLDINFHNIIINASGYKILSAMMLSINNLLRVNRERKGRDKLMLQQCLNDHIRILDCIKVRNPDEAAKVMLEHIEKHL